MVLALCMLSLMTHIALADDAQHFEISEIANVSYPPSEKSFPLKLNDIVQIWAFKCQSDIAINKANINIKGITVSCSSDDGKNISQIFAACSDIIPDNTDHASMRLTGQLVAAIYVQCNTTYTPIINSDVKKIKSI